MSSRPQDGYRAAGRIERGSSGRSRLLLGVVGLLVAGWLLANLASNPTTARETQPPQTRDPIETRTPPPQPTATALPAVDLLAGAPESPIPILVDGLAFLDPTTATLSRPTDNRDAQWPFLLADGSTVCVCLVESGLDSLPGLRIARGAPGGSQTTETLVDGWQLPIDRDRAFLDVALDTRSGSLLVVAAVLRRGSWEIRLDRVSLDGDYLTSMAVGDVPDALFAPSGPAGGARGVRLWLAPDGSRARIALASRLGRLVAPASPAVVAAWLVETPADALGRSTTIVPEPDDPAPGECHVDGWAGPDAFVRVCLEPGTEQGPDLVLHRLGLDDSRAEVTIGTASRHDDHVWLIDGTAGVVYGWSARAQQLFRVDVGSLAVTSRVLPVPDGSLSPVEAPFPAATSARVAWTPGEAGRGTAGGAFVGSPDGTLLYAAGIEPDTEPLETTSNGIYVFDAATLAVLGHWIPSATYESLGMTADGRYVMALGPPHPVELSMFGDRGSSLVFHRARSGNYFGVLRRVETELGGNVTFLVAGPDS